MDVEIIEPHGFCSGVSAALKKAFETPSAYCLHEIVHNELVKAELAGRGMRFVERLDDVPAGATVLFSAHGVGERVRAEAVRRGLRIVDATCPFVARAHRTVREFVARGIPVTIVGDATHAEVIGYLDELDGRTADLDDLPPGSPLGVVCQTTLNADEASSRISALARRFAVETTPAAEVCTATRDRQAAVRAFVRNRADRRTGVLVLGSATSSNTGRLAEIARDAGAFRVARAGNEGDLTTLDWSGADVVGVTSGASTPEAFLRAAVAHLLATGGRLVP